jgi:DNA-binding CsgD family transcriptional regulator
VKPTMAETDFSKLNKGQRQCLRLVLAHLNSKEIGRKLDISPHTVDQRLRQAMRTLSTNTRFEAARKFAEHEGASTYQPLIYQSPDIENFPKSEIVGSSVERTKLDDHEVDIEIPRVGSRSSAAALQEPLGLSNRFPFPRYRGEKNTLSAWERIGWIIAIAIGSAVSFGGILSGLEALSRLSG